MFKLVFFIHYDYHYVCVLYYIIVITYRYCYFCNHYVLVIMNPYKLLEIYGSREFNFNYIYAWLKYLNYGTWQIGKSYKLNFHDYRE